MFRQVLRQELPYLSSQQPAKVAKALFESLAVQLLWKAVQPIEPITSGKAMTK